MGKKPNTIEIELSHDAADDLFVKFLRYWDRLFTPRRGVWMHPDDITAYKERRKAIKVLLDYMT